MTRDSSSSLVRCLVKRMKTRDEPGNTPTSNLPDTQLDFVTDDDLTLTPSTEEEMVEIRSRYEDKCDDELSADYLACCYCYNKAFRYYRKVSVPFDHGTLSPKQRRDRILDMARTAKTRRASEIVREMMESELETSIDPLSKDGPDQSPQGEVEMCPMQSFLFHRHLAAIYQRRSDGTSLLQRHLHKAQGFTNAFDAFAPPSNFSFSEQQIPQTIQAQQDNAPPSIDLWTLLLLVPRYKVANIPETLLNSLDWGGTSLVFGVGECLDRCWGALTNTEPLAISVHHDAGQDEKMEPTDMSRLALQHDPLYIWTKTSLLFTFLWTKIQDKAPPIRKYHTISSTQFLMIMSRMIVRRSLHVSQHDTWPLDSESKLLELRASDRRFYRSVVQTLLLEHQWSPNHMKREFVTEFVEHYSWSPPARRESALIRQIQIYQIEALELTMAARRESCPTTSTSTTLREFTPLGAEYSDVRRASSNDEFLDWLVLPEDQLDSNSVGKTMACVKGGRYTPSSDSSSAPSYLGTSSIHFNALTGNPAMSRSLASQSSRSSQVSVSSSFKRFKASALKGTDSSEWMMGLSLHDPGGHLQDDCLRELQELQGPP